MYNNYVHVTYIIIYIILYIYYKMLWYTTSEINLKFHRWSSLTISIEATIIIVQVSSWYKQLSYLYILQFVTIFRRHMYCSDVSYSYRFVWIIIQTLLINSLFIIDQNVLEVSLIVVFTSILTLILTIFVCILILIYICARKKRRRRGTTFNVNVSWTL